MKLFNKQNHMKIKNAGFSLIELMVAMVIGIIVLLGLVSLFTNSSILNRAQTGLASLQENGRYAITRLKDDIEQAGRKHCATVAMPYLILTDWNQGYDMTTWGVDDNINFNNYASTKGLPSRGEIEIDGLSDPDQLPDSPYPSFVAGSYPLDPRYFIQGHECGNTSCQPDLSVIGADAATTFPPIGTTDKSRAAGTDILTVRYLNGGTRITKIPTAPPNPPAPIFTLAESVESSSNPALIADCDTSFVAPATWSGLSVTVNANVLPTFNVKSDLRAFDIAEDFHTVSYFVGIDEDPSDSSRKISSLYRSDNGNVQQLVEGVERFDVFYLAQLQTGHVARLTAEEVQSVTGGGDLDNDDKMDVIQGCNIPPKTDIFTNSQLGNGNGCLWRTIYAMEIHILLNTVNDSSMKSDESFIYSPDQTTAQKPGTTLASGLNSERMFRREFTAIVPIRTYTL